MWLIPYTLKAYLCRCPRFPTDAPWQVAVEDGRRVPFLLCVVLTLLGLTCIFFAMSSGTTSTVIADFPIETSRTQIGLYLHNHSLFPQELDQDKAINDTNSERRESNHDQNCIKKKFDISFLKVHKAGSTTLMKIFLRFAIENKLNIVLPRRSKGYGFNYLGYGQTLAREKIVPLPANESYNILCNHVVYNREAFRSIMTEDTVYVGIIREPVSYFKSAASYYGFYKHLQNLYEGKIPQERIVGEFLKKTLEFLKNNSHTEQLIYYVNNKMSFDFGIPNQKFHDNVFVEEYIKELDRDFSLVLILEHFQESLVLMKRILCWNTKDILYVPLNAMEIEPSFDLNGEDIDNLRKWNSADFKLYNYFYKVFIAKIASYGEDLKEEVENFKSIQENVKNFCNKILGYHDTSSFVTFPNTKWGDGFMVTLKDCKLMMEPESTKLEMLIENAWTRYNASKANT
ncbi:galactosylceramide sulfotransferase-like isoform X2 [Mercenaria mercenaria]|nr:galactosylceramide sulfotransferase-like isoform X2 [Mercenaria mercenaria]